MHRLRSFLLVSLLVAVQPLWAVDANPENVGVYDSRVVAFAHFWSSAERADRDALIAAARAAKAAGDTVKQRELTARIEALQQASHLEVLSTDQEFECFMAFAV
jgi:hypothetical protein